MERSIRYSGIEHSTNLCVLNINRLITSAFHIITRSAATIEAIVIPWKSH